MDGREHDVMKDVQEPERVPIQPTRQLDAVPMAVQLGWEIEEVDIDCLDWEG